MIGALKAEEEIKKTFAYKHNTLAIAGQKLKEEVVKAYGKPFLIICIFLNGIISTIKRALAYDRAIRLISKSQTIIRPSSDIEYIAFHSPLTLYGACEVYPFLQAYNLGREEIIRCAYATGGNVEAITHMLVKKFIDANTQNDSKNEKRY